MHIFINATCIISSIRLYASLHVCAIRSFFSFIRGQIHSHALAVYSVKQKKSINMKAELTNLSTLFSKVLAKKTKCFDFVIDWCKRHVTPCQVIFYLEVREVRSLRIDIYSFLWSCFLRLVGRVLWHINRWRLSNVKTFIYIYIYIYI